MSSHPYHAGIGESVSENGLRDYLIRVYNYMAGGLAVTGLVAYYGAASDVYASLAGTPWLWLVLLAPLAPVLLLSERAT